ncbi:hypothetical protein R1sor_001331 [Riccia sorocarpa]|uniref:Uncharacterized protein n=1 Tax=Riccia sorocarpa TaxID=122646 RepID=A0ABD3GY87_9MARC
MRRTKSGGHSNLYSTQRGRKEEEDGVDSASRGPKKRSASVGREETRSSAAASSSSGFRESSRRENVIDELKQLRQRIQSLEKKVAEQRQTMLQLERSNSAMTEDVSDIVRKVERAYADATRLRSPPRNPCTTQQNPHRHSGNSSSNTRCPSSFRWNSSSRYSPLMVAEEQTNLAPNALPRESDFEPGCTIREEESSTLFPGLSDEITINRILTLLPWSRLYLLSTLNRSWQNAFRSHQVYDARVRSGNTQTLFVLSHPSLVSLLQKSYDYKKLALSLYDSTRNAWHCLPSPTDGVAKTWRLGHFETVFLDGRLYVLGGLFKEKSGEVLHKGDEVHVLDLGACESTWRRCASMSVVRERFGCAAYDGKIFVFGGLEPQVDMYEYDYYLDREIWTNSEVFDPLKNQWSSTESMPLGRICHSVLEFRGELYMYGGSARPKGWSRYEGLEDMKDSDFTDAYDPSADQWRQVENFAKLLPQGALFSFGGQDGTPCVFDVTKDAIFRYDDVPFGYKRTRIQSHHMVSPGWSEGQFVSSCVSVEGELYALLVYRKKYYADEGGIRYRSPEAVLVKRSFDFYDSSTWGMELGSSSPSSSSAHFLSSSKPTSPRPPSFVYLDNLPPSVEDLCPIRRSIVFSDFKLEQEGIFEIVDNMEIIGSHSLHN